MQAPRQCLFGSLVLPVRGPACWPFFSPNFSLFSFLFSSFFYLDDFSHLPLTTSPHSYPETPTLPVRQWTSISISIIPSAKTILPISALQLLAFTQTTRTLHMGSRTILRWHLIIIRSCIPALKRVGYTLLLFSFNPHVDLTITLPFIQVNSLLLTCTSRVYMDTLLASFPPISTQAPCTLLRRLMLTACPCPHRHHRRLLICMNILCLLLSPDQTHRRTESTTILTVAGPALPLPLAETVLCIDTTPSATIPPHLRPVPPGDAVADDHTILTKKTWVRI